MTTTASPLAGKTVALDFDGVIHSYRSGWTGPVPLDPPEPGALEFVNALLDQGAKVVIVTTRAAELEGQLGTTDWLRYHGFPTGQLRVTNEKVPAIAYVDDRAVAYPAQSGAWGAVMSAIQQLAGKNTR